MSEKKYRKNNQGEGALCFAGRPDADAHCNLFRRSTTCCYTLWRKNCFSYFGSLSWLWRTLRSLSQVVITFFATDTNEDMATPLIEVKKVRATKNFIKDKMTGKGLAYFWEKCKKVKIEVTVPKKSTIFHRFGEIGQKIMFFRSWDFIFNLIAFFLNISILSVFHFYGYQFIVIIILYQHMYRRIPIAFAVCNIYRISPKVSAAVCFAETLSIRQ